METLLPVKLIGRNLGDRHHNLNILVSDAYQDGVAFDSIKDVQEVTPIDRLFKIDLASKYQLVDYILLCLKDEDMLYVSRALKCKWLLEPQYRYIMNPTYLEKHLFPGMLTTAINKLLHFIQKHLHETVRCEEFYSYYVFKNFMYAFNFLWHCSSEFVYVEAQKVLDKLTPHHLKVLAEKMPQFSKIYFESLNTNETLLKKYLSNESDYYKSIISVLKSKPDYFLDITEKYFNKNTHKRLSPAVTKYIMQNHKNRFINKCELYTAWILNINTIAKYLSDEDAKHIVLKLVKAKYLSHWFSFENVEPLLKRLKQGDKAAFEKQIFVDKSFGEIAENCPYPQPSPPKIKVDEIEISIFCDVKHTPLEYESEEIKSFKSCLKKRKMCKWSGSVKTELDILFDRFRFVSFSKTLFELRKEILLQSSADDRMKMILVLASKSGGLEEHVKELLSLLTARHINEPVHIRATVVRSLVKRAAAWRLQQPTWELLEKFAQGLGIDGTTAEAHCTEGLHALVLRHLLADRHCTPCVLKAFFHNFSTFTEYSLSIQEKNIVIQRLPPLLLNAENDAAEITETASFLMKVLDVFDDYKIRNDKLTMIIPAVEKLVQQDRDAAAEILRRLYYAKIARKHFMPENFDLFQTDASFLNALRHDIELITPEKFEKIVRENNLDGFLRKVVVYFSEQNGLAMQLLESLNKEIAKEPCVSLSRPLARLIGSSLAAKLEQFNNKSKGNVEKKMAYQLKINSHLTRPKFDVEQYGWKQAGLKVVDNKTSVCRIADVPKYIDLLCGWPRAAKLAIILGIRANLEMITFKVVAKLNPIVTLRYLLNGKLRNNFDLSMWDAIRSDILELDLSQYKHLRQRFIDIENLPINIRVEFISIMFDSLLNISLKDALPFLSHIENMLSEFNEEYIQEKVVKYFLNTEFTVENVFNDDDFTTKKIFLFLRIIAKYLLLSLTVEEQERKMVVAGEPLFKKITQFWVVNQSETKSTKNIIKFVQHFLLALKYSEVFLNLKYVSCLPVLKKVESLINEVFPLESYYSENMQIHFIILYYVSVRQSVEHDPEIFKHNARKENEGVHMIGFLFGFKIVDIFNAMCGESISIVNIYSEALVQFFNDYFNESENLTKFIMSVVKGIAEFGECLTAFFLAERVYALCSCLHNNKDFLDDILGETDDDNLFGYLNAAYDLRSYFN